MPISQEPSSVYKSFVYYENDPLARVTKAYSFGQNPSDPEAYALLQSSSGAASASDSSYDGSCVTSSSYLSASIYPENENYFKRVLACCAHEPEIILVFKQQLFIGIYLS